VLTSYFLNPLIKNTLTAGSLKTRQSVSFSAANVSHADRVEKKGTANLIAPMPVIDIQALKKNNPVAIETLGESLKQTDLRSSAIIFQSIFHKPTNRLLNCFKHLLLN